MYWVIGNQGQLGKELCHLFDSLNVSYIGSDKEIDITKPEEIAKQKGNFDWIINCAAYTAVDKAEDEQDLCYALNVIAPANIAVLAQERKAKLLHISTDYVFSGTGTRPYREDDPVDPVGVYGKTKCEGEKEVINRGGFVIRTSWLYGQYGNNFVKTMLRLMNEKDSISVVHDQKGSPTYAYDLAQTIYLFTQRVDKKDAEIYHYSNLGEISWYDFACEIYRSGKELGIMNHDCELRPCITAEYPTKAIRPQYSVLDTSKIVQFLDVEIPRWDFSLKEFLKKYSMLLE